MSEAAADARRFGLPDEAIAELEDAAEADKGCEVWSEHWDIVVAFLAVSTQWRIAGLPNGHIYCQGLDYAAAKVGLDMAGLTLTPAQWGGIRIMESEATSAMNRIRG